MTAQSRHTGSKKKKNSEKNEVLEVVTDVCKEGVDAFIEHGGNALKAGKNMRNAIPNIKEGAISETNITAMLASGTVPTEQAVAPEIAEAALSTGEEVMKVVGEVASVVGEAAVATAEGAVEVVGAVIGAAADAL